MTIKINLDKTPSENFIQLYKETKTDADIIDVRLENITVETGNKNTSAICHTMATSQTVFNDGEKVYYNRANLFPDNLKNTPAETYDLYLGMEDSVDNNLKKLLAYPLRWDDITHDFTGRPQKGAFKIKLTAKPNAYEIMGTYDLQCYGVTQPSGSFYISSKEPVKFGDFSTMVTSGSYSDQFSMAAMPLHNEDYSYADVANILAQETVYPEKITMFELLSRYFRAHRSTTNGVVGSSVNDILFDIVINEYIAKEWISEDINDISKFEISRSTVNITNSVTGLPDTVTQVTYYCEEFDLILKVYLDGDIDPTMTLKELANYNVNSQTSTTPSGIIEYTGIYGLADADGSSRTYLTYDDSLVNSDTMVTINAWASIESAEDLATTVSHVVNGILGIPNNAWTMETMKVVKNSTVIDQTLLFTEGFFWDDLKVFYGAYRPGESEVTLTFKFNDKQFYFPVNSTIDLTVVI